MAEAAIGGNHPAEGEGAPAGEGAWKQASYPLGAHFDPARGTTTFAVYSGAATRVLLEIHSAALGADARWDYWLERGPDAVWRAEVRVGPGTLYGYRCWGPNWDWDPDWRRGHSVAGFRADVGSKGERCNPNKLLIDPYARELSHDRETPEMIRRGHHAEMYGSGPGLYSGYGHLPVPRRVFDTGAWAPKGVVVRDGTPTGAKPRLDRKDLVIYEAHPRGLTRHPSVTRLDALLAGLPGMGGVEAVPEAERGTYAGAARMAKYLKALGVTAVEFLPVHESANDENEEEPPPGKTLYDPPHGNYWGYMTYGFFAPDRRYALDQGPGGPTREFKAMVAAFHAEGLEVILDVVYNHTGEGGLWEDGYSGEILSLRGLDNGAYYALDGVGGRGYWVTTGCGNNLDAASEPVRRLVLDSLAYWAGEMGVDGFRFDLATTLGRDGEGRAFRKEAELLRRITAFAAEAGVKLIAEPWDIHPRDGYQVGGFPDGWMEWNGRYRDSVRRFLKGDGNAREFADAVQGGCRGAGSKWGPWKGVNFITAHDGFTLLDLVSHNQKRNDVPWPFGPCDGGDDHNNSWDSGGDQALRRQRLRNHLAVLLLSRGQPMMVGGDEFARTLNGNNNPYRMDTIGSWLNWEMAARNAPTRGSARGGPPRGDHTDYADYYGQDGGPAGANGLFAFTRFLLALRRSHACLRQDDCRVQHTFRKEDGLADLEEGGRRVQWHIGGTAVGDSNFLVLINAGPDEAPFHIPPPVPGRRWRLLADTAAWAEAAGNHWPGERAAEQGGQYRVRSHSLALLIEGD